MASQETSSTTGGLCLRLKNNVNLVNVSQSSQGIHASFKMNGGMGGMGGGRLLFGTQPSQENGPMVGMASQAMMEACSQDIIGTADLCTPVEPPGGGGVGGGAAAGGMASPPAMSVMRAKRPRSEHVMDCSQGSQQPAPSQEMPPPPPRYPTAAGGAAYPTHKDPRFRQARAAGSPACRANPFVCAADDESNAAAEATTSSSRRPATTVQLARYRLEFKEVALIGTGGFSTVTRAVSRLDGATYAIKRTSRPLTTPGDQKVALFEVQSMAVMAAHPHVVRYFGAWLEDDRLFIQLEFCSGGTLADKLASGSLMPSDALGKLMRSMALALQHLHKKYRIAHLDVKPENIYGVPSSATAAASTSDVPAQPELEWKLGDFGRAQSLAPSSDTRGYIEEGDVRYMPLEMLNSRFDSLDKADIFSLGLTCYEAFTGYNPPQNGTKFTELRTKGIPLLPGLSNALHKAIRSCMAEDPVERPEAGELVKMSVVGAGGFRGALSLK